MIRAALASHRVGCSIESADEMLFADPSRPAKKRFVTSLETSDRNGVENMYGS